MILHFAVVAALLPPRSEAQNCGRFCSRNRTSEERVDESDGAKACMKKLLVPIGICCLHGAMCWAQSADVRVDLSDAGKKVSPNQFGIFFEEINHAGEGGLYADLVRNGSFTEAPTLDAWAAVRAGTANVNIFFEDENPLNAVKPRSVRIEVSSPNGERAGLSNEGYWGIAVQKGTSYQFAMYARSQAGFDGPVTVSLEGKDGAVYGQAQLNGLTQDWSRVTATIRSNGTDPTAMLLLTANRTTTFWIHVVTLRPEGDIFRADLLQKLKDIKPGFVRFPGGTYVQGHDRATSFRWKTTIGDAASRPGHYNAVWSYWSDDYMGYHEYLQLCEQLGAEPIYVAYAGMSWTPGTKSPFGVLQRGRISASDYPIDEMGPIVEDALDAIEYANGPADSKWGALRAKAGHPAPFGLKYVEIGNEDGENPLYPDRYKLIYHAIKAKYPKMQTLANDRSSGWGKLLPIDILDQHVYSPPLGAIALAKQLDGRDRRGPKALLGEYAVQRSSGFGNMREALAEAVLLGSIERNSDVMPMASYAPLLANVHALNWRPDLIYFDTARSYGTPSYYVQKMLADSRLDNVVPVDVRASELKLEMEGGTSVKGVNASAEVQEEKVSRSADGYTYTARVRKTAGDGGVVVRFATQDDGGPYLAWYLGVKDRANTELWGGSGNLNVPVHQLETSLSGPISREVNGVMETGRWYHVEIHVTRRNVVCSLDGKEIHHALVPETLGASVYGAAGRTTTGTVVIRLVNLSPLKQSASIDLTGAGANRYSTVASVLTSADLDAENSLDEPTRIAPVEHNLAAVGGKFQYEMEGNSFTVLKLTPEK
jgi:alpha-L-arabinofuranosidase